MKRTINLLVIASSLTVASLSAQDPIIIPQVPPVVEITVDPTPIINNIYLMTDSAMIDNLNRNLEALRIEIAAQECDTCGGTSSIVRVGAILLPVLLWIGWELRGIKNNSAGTPGEDGVDGVDGQDGEDGKDGKHQYGESG